MLFSEDPDSSPSNDKVASSASSATVLLWGLVLSFDSVGTRHVHGTKHSYTENKINLK